MMTLKQAALIPLAIAVIAVLIRAAIWCAQAADYVFDSDCNPVYHIRNDLYMVGIYRETYGILSSPTAELVVVNLMSDDRKERLVATISSETGYVSLIVFVDSTTISIDRGGDHAVIEYDLSSATTPLYLTSSRDR